MKYVVVKKFRDIEDNMKFYPSGSTYATGDESRAEELKSKGHIKEVETKQAEKKKAPKSN